MLPSGARAPIRTASRRRSFSSWAISRFDKGDLKTAGKHLTELLKNWNLNSDTYKQTVQMLLNVHLKLGPPSDVVRYFEIVKEKWPQEEIPFDKIVKVGAAYHEMGEYERSYLVFRATVESNFQRESGVAGFLESQGQFVRSVDVLGRLLREYPPEGYVAAAAYAPGAARLPRRRKSPMPTAAAGGISTASGDRRRHVQHRSGCPEKLNRVELLRRAWAMFESFLTAYPDDPAADQAAFADADVLLELKAVPGRRRRVRLLRRAISEERSVGRLLVRDRLLPFRRRRAPRRRSKCAARWPRPSGVDPATGREED